MADSATPKTMTLEEARDEIKKCEEEIQSIKVALRGISSANLSGANSLGIEFTKVEGLPEAAKPVLKLQLSAPIDEKDVSLGGEKATFEGVETSIATLLVDAKDADIPLGKGVNPVEIAPLCSIDDPKEPKGEYVKEVMVSIVAATEEGGTVTDVDPVVCSVTLKATFKPSEKDVRDELYDLLNKISQKKAVALTELRKRSVERARAGASSASDRSNAVTRSKPTVKPGFLQNGGKTNDDDDKGFISLAKKWYKRVTAPDSIVMKTAFFGIVTKDFWIFFGAVGLMHFKGDILSLPPPV